MKKLVSILLALSLMVCSAATVSAATITTDGGTDTGIVYVQYIPSDAELFEVEITWGNLEWTYQQGAWDGTQYTTGSWITTPLTSTIGIENKSTMAVDYSAKFGTENAATTNGVTATLSNNEGSLVAATASTGDKTATVGLAISGTPDETTLGQAKWAVGTITVTVSEAA